MRFWKKMSVSASISSPVLRLSFSLFLTLSLFMLLDSRDTRQDHNEVRYNFYLFLLSFSFFTIITENNTLFWFIITLHNNTFSIFFNFFLMMHLYLFFVFFVLQTFEILLVKTPIYGGVMKMFLFFLKLQIKSNQITSSTMKTIHRLRRIFITIHNY